MSRRSEAKPRQQISENVAERAAEEWRHFSDTEEGDTFSTGPHDQREGRHELDRVFVYPGIVGIDVARPRSQRSRATSQYELLCDQRPLRQRRGPPRLTG